MLLPMNVLLKNPYNSIFHFNQIFNFMFLGLKMHGDAHMLASWLPANRIIKKFRIASNLINMQSYE